MMNTSITTPKTLNGMSSRTRYIQLIAAPCSGKSTITHALFIYFSLRGFNIEYVSEYAKSLVYKGILADSNQFLISGTQYELLKELDGKVDIVITDTHILNGIVYSELPKYRNRLTDNQRVRLKNQLLEYNRELPGLTIKVKGELDEYVQEGRLEVREEILEIQTAIDKLTEDLSDIKTFINRTCSFKELMDKVERLGDSISPLLGQSPLDIY